MEKTKVIFNAADGVNYMQVEIDGIELYAEIPFPETEPDENGDYPLPDTWDDEHYPILKQMILNQAKEKGIDPEMLQFWWD